MSMEQRVINPSKVLRTLRKTTALLINVLDDVRDGKTTSDGSWGMREIVRHLAEYEPILIERVRLILAKDMPILPSIANQHITDAPDTEADTATLVQELLGRREQLLQLLDSLSPEQWTREGRHPQQGLATLLEVALNGAMHDIDHLDQLMELVR